MDVLLPCMKTTLILLYILPLELLDDPVHCQRAVICKESSCLSSSSQQWTHLEYSVNHLVNRCGVIQALLLYL